MSAYGRSVEQRSPNLAFSDNNWLEIGFSPSVASACTTAGREAENVETSTHPKRVCDAPSAQSFSWRGRLRLASPCPSRWRAMSVSALATQSVDRHPNSSQPQPSCLKPCPDLHSTIYELMISPILFGPIRTPRSKIVLCHGKLCVFVGAWLLVTRCLTAH